MAASFTTCTWKSRYISYRIYWEINDVTIGLIICPSNFKKLASVIPLVDPQTSKNYSKSFYLRNVVADHTTPLNTRDL